jgi:hypothetical protein
MKRISLILVAGSVLAATVVVPAAIPDPVRIDTGLVSGIPGTSGDRDKTSGRAMVLGDKVEAESAPDATALALYDAVFARQLNAQKTH